MARRQSASIVNLGAVRAGCSECMWRNGCLPKGLPSRGLADFHKSMRRTRVLRKGEYLYRAGDRLQALYAVQAGSMKTSMLTHDGQVQVLGFLMSGDLLGIDAINDESHPCDAIALETTVLCVLPFRELEAMAQRYPVLHQRLVQLMSQELVRTQEMMFVLGYPRAESRVAAYLLILSKRYRGLHRPGDRFTLPMTRKDLADFLGLALETVSRLLTRFHAAGLLHVHGRQIHLLDFRGLADIAESRSVHHAARA